VVVRTPLVTARLRDFSLGQRTHKNFSFAVSLSRQIARETPGKSAGERSGSRVNSGDFAG
jgi:hypothetical protein